MVGGGRDRENVRNNVRRPPVVFRGFRATTKATTNRPGRGLPTSGTTFKFLASPPPSRFVGVADHVVGASGGVMAELGLEVLDMIRLGEPQQQGGGGKQRDRPNKEEVSVVV